MSDELALTARLSFNKGGASVTRAVNITVDVTGEAYTSNVQLVTTASEVEILQGAGLGQPGYIIAKNLHATNYVEIGATTGVYTIKILAGETAMWRHDSTTIFAIAHTTDCLLEYTIIEE